MSAIIFKCPNCGGDLRFAPEKQTFQCEYCLSEFTREQMEQASSMQAEGAPEGSGASGGQPEGEREGSGASGMQTAGVPERAGASGMQAEGAPEGAGTPGILEEDGIPGRRSEGAGMVYTCPSCGAEIVTDETTAATFCYYCHNPVVLAGRVQGDYRPDGVIPFAIDRKKALEIFEQWIAGKKYLPRAFYAPDQMEKMTGVYFPYWLYDCQVEGELEAEGKKQQSWTQGNVRFSRVESYVINRNGTMEIRHVARNALSKANRKLAEGVMPFETNQIEPFQMGYLSGFVAEKRDMEKQQFSQEVKEEVSAFAEQSLRSCVSGYDSVQYHRKETRILSPQWQYVLMPVWTMTYRDPKTEKIYYFACNGQTGKICGELPVDPGRLTGLFLTCFLPLLAVLLVIGYWI